MGSVCQCLFRICCEVQDDDEEREEVDQRGVFAETTQSRMMHRGSSPVGAGYQHPQGQGLVPGSVTEEDSVASRNNSDNCCQREPHAQGIHDFFRSIRDRWLPSDHAYDIMRQGSADEDEPPKKLIPPSPLRQAVSYDSSHDIPCISADEVVMPGSLLQKEMAKQMMSAKLTDDDVECVICMEGFDASNPRMPTLCGCGENKTYFHLPCLYQWLEQSRDCPSCRKKLNWEEF
jgi:Ring finger domain